MPREIILIVKLSEIESSPDKVLAAPLGVEGADGAPATVLQFTAEMPLRMVQMAHKLEILISGNHVRSKS